MVFHFAGHVDAGGGVYFGNFGKVYQVGNVFLVDAASGHNGYAACGFFYQVVEHACAFHGGAFTARGEDTVAAQFYYVFQGLVQVGAHIERAMEGYAQPELFGHSHQFQAAGFIYGAIGVQDAYHDAVGSGFYAVAYIGFYYFVFQVGV
jgi:hypothetical protein